jgi:hypothetical protein
MDNKGKDFPAGYLNLLFSMTQVSRMTCREMTICRSASEDLRPMIDGTPDVDKVSLKNEHRT